MRALFFGLSVVSLVLCGSARAQFVIGPDWIHLDSGISQPMEDPHFGTPFLGSTAMAPDGSFAFLWHDTSGAVAQSHIIATHVNPQGRVTHHALHTESTFDPRNPPNPGAIVFDDKGRLYSFRAGLRMRIDGGEEATISVDLPPEVGARPAITILCARRAASGQIHLLLTTFASGVRHLVRLDRDMEGGTWSAMSLGEQSATLDADGFAFDEFFAAELGVDGSLHVCYRSAEPFGGATLPRSRLSYARWSEGGGWAREVVRQGASVDDRPAVYATMAIDRDGNPHIVAAHSTHYQTGSMIDLKLFHFTRTHPNQWARREIASSADGYVGGDGNRYTGASPWLIFDATNTGHLVFADVSSWHWTCIPTMPGISCNDTIRGQLRYGRFWAGQWTLQTILHQPGKSASPNPVHLMAGHRFFPGADGQYGWFLAAEQVFPGDSPAYQIDRTSAFTLRLVPAGLDGAPIMRPELELVDQLLRRIPATTNSDRNMDGAFDAADIRWAQLPGRR